MAKSILKDNQNHTAPIVFGDNNNNNNTNTKNDESGITVNSNYNNNNNNNNNNSNNNRRVSFAREVTLHKIDYVENPNNKRRKTDIGITYQDYGIISGDSNLENDYNNSNNGNSMNNINEQDEHEEEQGDETYGEKMLVDSSDEEQEGGHVIDVNDKQEDHEEQTMDLTSVGVPEYMPPIIYDGKSSTDQQYPEVEGEEEEDMELTEGMPRKIEYSSPKENNVVDQNNEDEDITMDVTNVISHICQSVNQNENHNQVQDNDLNEKSEPANADDTQPMELTQTFETVTRSNIEKPVLQEVTEEQESEDGVEQPDSEKTEIKEQEEEERVLTDQIIDDNDEENADDHKPGNISSNDFSEHMDLTIVDYKKIDYNGPLPEIPRGDGFDNGELSFAMDLTEIQLFVRPRNDNLTPEVKDNEKQEGDQTNNKETGIDDPDTNAITQDTQHNEAKPKENEPQLDEDIENEAMELTQTIPMKIINSHEDTDSISKPSPIVDDLPDESLSQPMELTQIDSKITTGKEESDLGDASQPMDLTQTISNISHDEINTSGIEERVTTTTIPLAEITQDDINQEEDEGGEERKEEEKETVVGEEEEDEVSSEDDSFDEDDPNYIPVSLSKFLSDIRVQFYDDLELDLNSIPRLSITNSIELPTIHDYIKAKPNLELLELYEFCCNELNKKIIQGRELYNEYEKTVLVNNPILFKKYYSMDDKTKLLINLKIQLIRDFARLKSKKTWYDWRNQLTENLIDKLDEEINSLTIDKQEIIKDINRLNELYDKTRIYLKGLNHKFNELIRLKNEINEIPPNELNKLQLDVRKRKQDIVEINKEIEIKLSELSTIKKNLDTSNNKKLTLQTQLNDLENQFNQIRKYDNLEIKLILQKYQFLQHLTNLKYLKTIESGQKISFLFDDSIICEFDFINNNILYTVKQNNFKNKLLIEIYEQFVIDGDKQDHTITDKFQMFHRNWQWLKKIDSDFYYISLKFPIELKIVHHQDNDNDDDGKKALEFTIKYYNFKHDYKVLICGKIDINKFLIHQLFNTHNNIEFTGEIIYQRGEINNKSFRDQISNDLKVFDKQILNNLIIVNK